MDFNRYWNSDRDDYSNRPNVAWIDEHLPYLTDYCKKIVDLGCGNGELVKKLNDMGIYTIGITYNTEEVETSVDERVLYGDMQNLDKLNDCVADGFIMWDSLEHCQSAYIALCEAKRILRPYGRGLIFMPGQNWLNCHCHITCYTIPQMEQLFRQAGLKLIKTYKKEYELKHKLYGTDTEGMAVYEVEKDPEYKAVFVL